MKAMKAMAAMKAMRDITLKFIGADKEVVAIPGEEDPARIIFQALETVLEPAMEQRASRVDFGLSSGGCIASMTGTTWRKMRILRTPVSARARA